MDEWQTLAVIDSGKTSFYTDLNRAADRIASHLLNGSDDLCEARVAFLIPPGFDYVSILRGIWRAGGIAVPLCPVHPRPELEYVVSDSDAAIVVAHPEFEERLCPIAQSHESRFLRTTDFAQPLAVTLPNIAPTRRAMMLYTSGTTGKPKGVVTTHANIAAQAQSLIEAWEWSETDRILHVLPLHHIHGIVNALVCPLRVGAAVEFQPRFDPIKVWDRFADGDITLFMAVPTIYSRLIAAWEAAPPERQREWSEACSRLRLMVSGSAALPVTVLANWRRISGHTLLERYGMTEIGMALSNPYRGERVAGSVGTPLPGVEVRLTDESGNPVGEGVPGEIEVRGQTVFLEYWNRPDATREAFRDGWFRTGDIAVLEDGRYRILGRNSVDILKSGGYKVSALEIENVLREHPAILECAVVGVPDAEWGERVCAALVLRDRLPLSAEELRVWAKERLAPYKVPKNILFLPELPRNAMGKVLKPDIAGQFAVGSEQ